MRDWLKREPDPRWKDSVTVQRVVDSDVLLEAARLLRTKGHDLPASVLEKWAADEFQATGEEAR